MIAVSVAAKHTARDYLLACSPCFVLAFSAVPYFHICVTPSWIWTTLFYLPHAIQCYKWIIQCICDSCKAYNVKWCLKALTRIKANAKIHIYIRQTKPNTRIQLLYTPSQMILRQYVKHNTEKRTVPERWKARQSILSICWRRMGSIEALVITSTFFHPEFKS